MPDSGSKENEMKGKPMEPMLFASAMTLFLSVVLVIVSNVLYWKHSNRELQRAVRSVEATGKQTTDLQTIVADLSSRTLAQKAVIDHLQTELQEMKDKPPAVQKPNVNTTTVNVNHIFPDPHTHQPKIHRDSHQRIIDVNWVLPKPKIPTLDH
jgi:cell division protein FtsL